MKIWLLVVLAGLLAVAAIVGLFMSFSGSSKNRRSKGEETANDYERSARQQVDNIFDDTFREELRNRGKLHFESVVSKNAALLQQDLQTTFSQLNEHIKSEVSKKLEAEFSKYEEAVGEAKQTAIKYIQDTNSSLQNYQQSLDEHLKKEIDDSKQHIIKNFENNMTKIISHYLQAAITDQFNIDSQLEYILANLETNKEAIIKDIESGS